MGQQQTLDKQQQSFLLFQTTGGLMCILLTKTLPPLPSLKTYT